MQRRQFVELDQSTYHTPVLEPADYKSAIQQGATLRHQKELDSGKDQSHIRPCPKRHRGNPAAFTTIVLWNPTIALRRW